MIHQLPWGIYRPSFLLLTPLVIMLGVFSLPYEDWSVMDLTLVLLGGMAAHMSVNALNEIADFYSGLDFITQRTPFSGGSGTLVQNSSKLHQAWWLAALSLALTLAVGIYFVVLQGWALLPLGLLGLALVVFYTPWITRNRLLSGISAGLGFGPVMVLGTQLALSGHTTTAGWLISLVPFFLVNNLLLLNQFPDRDADAQKGRHNWVIDFGVAKAKKIYIFQGLMAFLVLALGIFTQVFHPRLAFGFIGILLLSKIIMGLRHHHQAPELLPFLGMNVALSLTTPLLLNALLLLSIYL